MKHLWSWISYSYKRTFALLFMLPLALCSGHRYMQIVEESEARWLSIDGHITNVTSVNGVRRMNNVMRADACNSHGEDCIKDVLLIRGTITVSTLFDLNQMFERHTTTTVCLDSPGGSGVIAWFISHWIAAKNLNTCMAASYRLLDFPVKLSKAACFSACPFVLASGQQRIAVGYEHGDIQTIGVHQGRIGLSSCLCDYTLASGFHVPKLELIMPSDRADFARLFALSNKATYDKIFPLQRNELDAVQMFTRWL